MNKSITTVEKITEAIDNGMIISIKYFGGTQPGAVRDIFPVKLSDNKVEARCLNSKKTKLFFIKKIEVLNNNSITGMAWIEPQQKPVIYEDISTFYEANSSKLSILGWHIKHENNSLSLHNKFKNGKIKKKSTVSITFNEYNYAIDYDEELGNFVEKPYEKRQRPWTVTAHTMKTRTFNKIGKALDLFMEHARLLVPPY